MKCNIRIGIEEAVQGLHRKCQQGKDRRSGCGQHCPDGHKIAVSQLTSPSFWVAKDRRDSSSLGSPFSMALSTGRCCRETLDCTLMLVMPCAAVYLPQTTDNRFEHPQVLQRHAQQHADVSDALQCHICSRFAWADTQLQRRHATKYAICMAGMLWLSAADRCDWCRLASRAAPASLGSPAAARPYAYLQSDCTVL